MLIKGNIALKETLFDKNIFTYVCRLQYSITII